MQPGRTATDRAAFIPGGSTAGPRRRGDVWILNATAPLKPWRKTRGARFLQPIRTSPGSGRGTPGILPYFTSFIISLSSRLRIFPTPLVGIWSRNSILLGTL